MTSIKLVCIGATRGVGSQAGYEVVSFQPHELGTILVSLRMTVKAGIFQQGKVYDFPLEGMLGILFNRDTLKDEELKKLKDYRLPISTGCTIEDDAFDSELGVIQSGDQHYGINTLKVRNCLTGHPAGMTVKEISRRTGLESHQVHNALYPNRGKLFVKYGTDSWCLIKEKDDERRSEGQFTNFGGVGGNEGQAFRNGNGTGAGRSGLSQNGVCNGSAGPSSTL